MSDINNAEQVQEALEKISDLAIALCVRCRENIGDKQFINWCHDQIGVAILDICNEFADDTDPTS